MLAHQERPNQPSEPRAIQEALQPQWQGETSEAVGSKVRPWHKQPPRIYSLLDIIKASILPLAVVFVFQTGDLQRDESESPDHCVLSEPLFT